jgi:acyl-CoA thioesterase YciA
MSDWPTPSDRPAILTVALPGTAASGSTVFGGWIMGQFDLAAGRAGKVAAGPCVIRAVQEMVFHAPLHTGTDFAVYAREVARGRTSFTLELAGIADPDRQRITIATARFAMVAVDGTGASRPLVA